MLETQADIVSALCISEEFLPGHHDVIRKRLKRAAFELTTGHSDVFSPSQMFALNQCMHLTSNVVLLGSVGTVLRSVVTKVKSAYPDEDPTTIVTIAALYDLLSNYPRKIGAWRGQANGTADEAATLSDEVSTMLAIESQALEEGEPTFGDLCTVVRGNFMKAAWILGEDMMQKLGIPKHDPPVDALAEARLNVANSLRTEAVAQRISMPPPSRSSKT